MKSFTGYFFVSNFFGLKGDLDLLDNFPQGLSSEAGDVNWPSEFSELGILFGRP